MGQAGTLAPSVRYISTDGATVPACVKGTLLCVLFSPINIGVVSFRMVNLYRFFNKFFPSTAFFT